MEEREPRFKRLRIDPEEPLPRRRRYRKKMKKDQIEPFFWFVLFCSVFNLGTVDLAVRKEAMAEQELPPALLLGIRRPEFLFRTSVQTDNTPSKVDYILSYRTGTWIFAHGDSCHLTTEEGIIPGDTGRPSSAPLTNVQIQCWTCFLYVLVSYPLD
uniref:Uncharacterized protein n=1 Tax=Spermophilus dauricus TaxID=99837 RepID=A0A8C9P2L9_SPEDA